MGNNRRDWFIDSDDYTHPCFQRTTLIGLLVTTVRSAIARLILAVRWVPHASGDGELECLTIIELL